MKNEKCWYRNVCQNSCESCIRFLEMSYLIEASGLPELYKYPKSLECEDEDYKAFTELAEIKNDIVDFVRNGENLFIAGENTGTGKTSWASKILLKYFNEIWAGNGFQTRGIFVHVPALLLQLKDFKNPVSEIYKQNLLECDVVIWDDIASTDISNYDLSQLMIYLDGRLSNGKSNIYTGNIILKQKLEKILGARLASRIWYTSQVIIFKGRDRRAI